MHAQHNWPKHHSNTAAVAALDVPIYDEMQSSGEEAGFSDESDGR